ncbi:hypothetical protein PMAYCL1PPCAC_06593, partial [Pristionchus mayeri]
PKVELPTDWPEEASSHSSSTTSSSSLSSSSRSTTTSTEAIPSTTINFPPSSTHSLFSSTRRTQRIDDEEGLIQVKSSVLIKPRNYSRVFPSSTELTTPPSPPSPTFPSSTPFPHESSRVLPTDDETSLSGVYRVKGVKSEGKVLPTDSDDEEGILIVKSGIMQVKEKEETKKEGSNRVEDVTHKNRVVELKEEVRYPKGRGSVQEAEVSSGVTIGVGGNRPSSLKSSPDGHRLSSRSNINSSSSSLLFFPFLFSLL